MSPTHVHSADRNSQRKLIAILGTVVFIVVPLVAYLIWSGYTVAIHNAETTTRNYAAILEARLDATLRRADADLLEFANMIPVAALRQQAVPRYARELKAELDQHLINFKEVGGLLIFDSHGDMLYSSTSVSASNVNVSDRSYFRQLRDKPRAGLVFSEVITGRVTKRPIIVIARALTDERGSFSGVVIATLQLEHFQTLFMSLDVGSQGLIVLRRSDDHRLVTGRPHLASAVNKPLNSEHPLMKEMAAGARMATLHYAAQTDGIERIVSYQML